MSSGESVGRLNVSKKLKISFDGREQTSWSLKFDGKSAPRVGHIKRKKRARERSGNSEGGNSKIAFQFTRTRKNFLQPLRRKIEARVNRESARTHQFGKLFVGRVEVEEPSGVLRPHVEVVLQHLGRLLQVELLGAEEPEQELGLQERIPAAEAAVLGRVGGQVRPLR